MCDIVASKFMFFLITDITDNCPTEITENKLMQLKYIIQCVLCLVNYFLDSMCTVSGNISSEIKNSCVKSTL